MSFKFEFDEKAFKRAVGQQIEDHVKDVSRDMTRDFDRLHAEFSGRPVDEIKPALKKVWERDGGSISDPELTEYAQLISDGTRIAFEPGGAQW